MRRVPFAKANGCGNDFLIIESRFAPTDIAGFTRRICDRTRGVGADGVEWVSSSPDLARQRVDLEARLINSDGSGAEVSGNGTRCVAAWWHAREISTQHRSVPGQDAAPREIASGEARETVRILTGAGVKVCSLIDRSINRFEFESAMGEATVRGEAQLKLKSGEVRGVELSTGNPHFVVFVENFDFAWQQLAAEIQAQHGRFPSGTNVEFVRRVNANEVESRFFERGAGETRSSGTGSCASAVAAIWTRCAESPVKVVAPGGPQHVRWQDGKIFLRGPAEIICEGEYMDAEEIP